MDPAGETGGVVELYPGGFTIMMLRVTLTCSSDDSSPKDRVAPVPSDSVNEFTNGTLQSAQRS